MLFCGYLPESQHNDEMDARSSSTLQEPGLVAWCLTLITPASYIRCRDHDTGFGPPSYSFASEAGEVHQTSHASCLVSPNSSDDKRLQLNSLQLSLSYYISSPSAFPSTASALNQSHTPSQPAASISFISTKTESGKGGRGIG